MKKIISALIVAVSALIVSPVLAEEAAPLQIAGATTIDVKTAEAMFNDDSNIFVDPRKQADFERGHIPGSIHLDLNAQSTALTEASLLEALGGSKDTKVVFYCNGDKCMRSPQACEKAVSWGFKNVYFFRDGFPAWQAAGLPVE